nr:hypothetical protein [Tanacetum cinerariifolium]
MSKDEEYDLQRVVERKGKGIAIDEQAAQSLLEDDTSANVVRDIPSLADAETRGATKKSDSEGDTEILNVDEERGENFSITVALEERTFELDKGQAGSDPANTLESRPLPNEDQAGSSPRQSHHTTEENVHIKNPLSSSRTLSLMKNLDDVFTIALYEALEASMDREYREEFVEAMAKSRKRHRDDQDPPPPPLIDSHQNKKKRHDSDASALKQPQA